MTTPDPITQFVAMYPTHAAAAKAIGVDNSFISHLMAGRRRVSPEIALRIERASKGLISKESLIWPEAG